jgi:hypothetical protein
MASRPRRNPSHFLQDQGRHGRKTPESGRRRYGQDALEPVLQRAAGTAKLARRGRSNTRPINGIGARCCFAVESGVGESARTAISYGARCWTRNKKPARSPTGAGASSSLPQRERGRVPPRRGVDVGSKSAPLTRRPRWPAQQVLRRRLRGELHRAGRFCNRALTRPEGPNSRIRGRPPLEQALHLRRRAVRCRSLVAQLLHESPRANRTGARGPPRKAAQSRRHPRSPCLTSMTN